MSKTQAQAMLCLGSKLKYWVYNDDKPTTIVLIHGFRGTHHGLKPVVDELKDYRLVVPDLPAFGASTPMTKSKHTIDGYADCIKELIAGLGVTRPNLLGHSMGAIIASSLAARYPQLIDRLILLNPIPQPTDNDRRQYLVNLVAFYYWLGKTLPESTGRAVLSNGVLVRAASSMMTITKDDTLRKEIHDAHQKHFSDFHNPKLLHEIYKESSTTSVSAFASKIKMPTLIVVGNKDNIAPIAGQKRLYKKFENAKLLVIKDVGHLTNHEAPHKMAGEIHTFLSGD